MARTKTIARLLTRLNSTYTGLYHPLREHLDPLTRRALIEAITARLNDTDAGVRKAAADFLRRRFDPSRASVAVLFATLQ